MKRLWLAVFAGAVFFTQTAVLAGQLPVSLERYQGEVKELISSTSNEAVKSYLRTCLVAADYLKGLEAEDPRVFEAFNKFVAKYSEGDIFITAPQNRRDSAVRKESAAYGKYLAPYRDADYINLVRLQDQLFERKYFKTEIAGNSNYFESWLNDHWAFTSAATGDVITVFSEPSLGVPPWEVVVRAEPAFVFNNSTQTILLGVLGLSYTYFPAIDRSTTPALFKESILSEYVQKSGVRLGAGVGQIKDKASFLLGIGAQINILGVWVFYEPDNKSGVLGFAVNNLSILKSVLPWFE